MVVLFFCVVSAGVVWRLVAQEDAASSDWDGDGLSDGVEVSLGSDPFDYDSDGDGFDDGIEEAWGTSDLLDATSFPVFSGKVVGRWLSQAATGLEVADEAGNGHRGQLKGTVLPSWDSVEQAMVFDGVGNEVEILDGEELTPVAGFTLAAWVRVPPSSRGAIVSKWGGGFSESKGSYSLSVVEGRLVLETMLLGTYRPLFGQRVVADDEWHFVVGSYDGEALRIFVDGRMDVQAHTGGAVDVVAEPVRLGLMGGRLSSVELYDHGLRDDEVILLYQLATVDGGEGSARLRRLPNNGNSPRYASRGDVKPGEVGR